MLTYVMLPPVGSTILSNDKANVDLPAKLASASHLDDGQK